MKKLKLKLTIIAIFILVLLTIGIWRFFLKKEVKLEKNTFNEGYKEGVMIGKIGEDVFYVEKAEETTYLKKLGSEEIIDEGVEYKQNINKIYKNGIYYFKENNTVYEFWEYKNGKKNLMFYISEINEKNIFFDERGIYYLTTKLYDKKDQYSLYIKPYNSSESYKIYSDISQIFKSLEEKIYAVRDLENKRILYTISEEFEEKQVAYIPKGAYNIQVFDEKVFYIKDGSIYTIVEGISKLLFEKTKDTFEISENNLYYIQQNGMYRYDIEKQTRELIVDEGESKLKIYKDWIYYYVKDRGIYKINLKGKHRSKVFGDASFIIKDFFIFDDYVSYCSEEYEGRFLKPLY